MAKAAQRRRERQAASYARRGPVREAYDYVLIVCEGEKTEPNYLHGLRSEYRLSSANIVVLSPDGTDPVTIVQTAEAKLEEGYDRIFCVFDRNGHANFQAALNRVAAGNGKIIAVPSWPCFEFWLLLHFKYTAAAFQAGGGLSSCERALRELKVHFPAYAKGHRAVFADLHSRLPQALEHAKRLAADNRKTGSQNPSTTMHDLVEYLIGLKE
jgi:hypothetical protein